MGSSHICIYYCANLPSLCPWLQITKRFSIKKTLSGHPSSFLELNPIQFPISPNYQSKNRKKASSHGKLKSIQVFIRLVVLIWKEKFHLLTTPCNCPLSNRELGLNQIEWYFTHRIDLSCVGSYSRFINVQLADYITRILNCYVNLMWYVIKLECETVTFSSEDSERNKCMLKFVLNWNLTLYRLRLWGIHDSWNYSFRGW